MSGSRCHFLAGLALALCVAVPALASENPPTASRIQVEYAPANNPAHEELRSILIEHRILEQFIDALAMLILPKPLTIKLDACLGDADSWYEPAFHTVTVCYDYVEELRENAPKTVTADGVSPEDAVIGPVMEVVLHEVAHALFHMLDLPILGREEDAADQFAAIMLLQMGGETARRAIAATAYMYWREAQSSKLADSDFASAHSPPIMRFYNLVCIAYGWDPEAFGYVQDKYISAERAGECQQETALLKASLAKLLRPHIDETLRRGVLITDWLPAARRMLHGK